MGKGYISIKRASLHGPPGAFTALIAGIEPVLCLVFGLGFLTYEVVEDWRVKDRGYLDVFGFLCGFAFGAVGLWALREWT
jgi:hypothetical protein